MSNYWASSCRGKQRYNSERKADVAAKDSQIVYGVEMNSYLCGFCHKWHVGNTFARNGKAARREREEVPLIFSVDKELEQV